MPECKNLISQRVKRSKLYQPGVFWQEVSKRMIEAFDTQGKLA